jgi:hypothetical protein
VQATQHGAIAQLGERNTGSVEVGGSIPPSSTNSAVEMITNKDVISNERERSPSVFTQVPIFIKTTAP